MIYHVKPSGTLKTCPVCRGAFQPAHPKQGCCSPAHTALLHSLRAALVQCIDQNGGQLPRDRWTAFVMGAARAAWRGPERSYQNDGRLSMEKSTNGGSS